MEKHIGCYTSQYKQSTTQEENISSSFQDVRVFMFANTGYFIQFHIKYINPAVVVSDFILVSSVELFITATNFAMTVIPYIDL